ncbi:hypothetical protein JR316_0012843 [Psilocybe cubensis]|uniref:GST N-terminal domain-containing protein n=2 Tax=Psilocybe cubensis TaxID=181762 RepID=A0A8H8CGJ6_PSICU|nr:hypothetical protein JR316_0012843 [Psilocybe cubensis]KAH9474385.1 hypothetical protein JR316_0012843 [Psilocybe cubensis]
MSSRETTRYTLVGTPFSTFTRTIALTLLYKSLDFTQIKVYPHSEEAKTAHPFGIIPTLIIEESKGVDDGKEGYEDNSVKLCETQAIIRYIDRIKPNPTLHYDEFSLGKGILEEKMWEYVSFVSSYGFPTIEHGLVKPRLKHLESGLASDAITPLLAHNIPQLHTFLSITETVLPGSRSSYPKFMFTDTHPTYADFYLFPILADLRPLPEWISGVLEHEYGQRMNDWMDSMDGLDCVNRTKEGTLSAGVGIS